MAGVFGSKIPKNKQFNQISNNEIVKETPLGSQKPTEIPKFSLRGILGLGQTVELNKQKDNLSGWGKELFGSISHLEQEERLLFDSRQKELQKNIEELRVEIHQLARATDNLESQVENATINPTAEPSLYQVTYLERIKNFIANFRKNISQASAWLETMSTKKKKKNYYWNTVKNKKHGGEQYLFSEEHSVSRSGS